jgi:hypothetical protein
MITYISLPTFLTHIESTCTTIVIFVYFFVADKAAADIYYLILLLFLLFILFILLHLFIILFLFFILILPLLILTFIIPIYHNLLLSLKFLQLVLLLLFDIIIKFFVLQNMWEWAYTLFIALAFYTYMIGTYATIPPNCQSFNILSAFIAIIHYLFINNFAFPFIFTF